MAWPRWPAPACSPADDAGLTPSLAVPPSQGGNAPPVAPIKEQRNRGIELGGFGEPLRGVRVIAGIAYIDSKQTKTGVAATEGKHGVGVPNYTFNAEWDLPWLAGLTLSGRYLQTGAQYADVANRVRVPSWNRFDLGARYSFKAAQQRYTPRAAVENVANKAYWASAYGGYLVQGAPRTVKLSMTVDF
ncbi:TonB-dependent receptor [Cupriavidus sp. P-10]|uniref:TonB-dependent receptor domain-containing protein n=1 Tax=Cupriavidus sp. P-10 TaxID=2027911 RepID=UPI001F3FD732|nr:TonB-dependent receptor [Cupriavidus sp. P-10]BDB26146.1 TonB-dependent receptor [Cupriavidus sp. P-10]